MPRIREFCLPMWSAATSWNDWNPSNHAISLWEIINSLILGVWYLYLICYAFLRHRFLGVETNPGIRHLAVSDVCRILCSNVRGLAGNLTDLTVASSRYDILLCSETLVSDMHHVSELLVSDFGRPVLLYRGRMPRARGMAAYVRDWYGSFRQPKFDCGCG